MTDAVRTSPVLVPAIAIGVCAPAVVIFPDIRIGIAIVSLTVLAVAAAWTMASATRWIFGFLAAAWLLPPFPVAAGNSGPHVAVLLACFGLLAGIVRATEWRLRFDRLSGSVLWVFFALAASIPWAFAWSGLSIGFASAVRLALFGIGIYMFFYVRSGPGRMSESQVRSLLRAIILTGSVSALIACVDFYFQLPAPAGYGAQFVWLDSGVFRRAQGVFYEASTLGNLCAFLIEAVAVAVVMGAGPVGLKRPVLLLVSIPLVVALVLSYSRGSLVNIAVAMLVLLWMSRRRLYSMRAGLAVLILAAAAIAILVQVFPSFFEAYLIRAVASLQYFAESPNSVLSGRLSTWSALVDYIARHPLTVLVGTGYKTLPYSELTGNLIADNTWLSVLIETGLSGFAGLVALNIAVLASCSRSARSTSPTKSFVATWFLCFWWGQMAQMLSADLLTYWRLLPVYFCVLAIATTEQDQSST